MPGCDEKVGVVKRLDLEKVSKEIQDLVKTLDDEVSVSVPEVKKISHDLHKMIAAIR